MSDTPETPPDADLEKLAEKYAAKISFRHTGAMGKSLFIGRWSMPVSPIANMTGKRAALSHEVVNLFLTALREAVAIAEPYMEAVQAAHNGYSSVARKAMPGLQEPSTPAEAIRTLLEEAEALGHSEAVAAKDERIAELEKALVTVPRTKDGEAAQPGVSVVYHPRYGGLGGRDMTEWQPPGGEWDCWCVAVHSVDGGHFMWLAVSSCYFTATAAIAAGEDDNA